MRLTVKNVLCALWACGLLASMAPQAATLVSQPPDQVSGDNMSQYVVAESFSLAGLHQMTGLSFWGLLGSAADYSGSVYWAIHSDGGGAPGAVVASGVSAAVAQATGNSVFGFLSENRFDISLSFQLNAGNYWLALHNGPLSNDGFSDMYWSTSSAGDGFTGQFDALGDAPDLGWLDTGNEHAFALFGDRVGNPVPVPASGLLVLTALALAAPLRRGLPRGFALRSVH